MVNILHFRHDEKMEAEDGKFDVEKKLAELSIHEKIMLLGGKDTWHTVDLPHRGIGSVTLSDGPSGVRGTKFFNGTPSSCFPCSTGIAASFDLDYVRVLGEHLGRECRAKAAHVILGPTINQIRSPLGGRGFEAFSEDPFLSGKVAARYVQGVQSEGVAATLKHFVGNEQEHERFSTDSVIPERALREIYLEPFRIATKEADPKCYMSGYNLVNGVHCSENNYLLDDVLRKEWGYKGMIMSDWTGTYSSAPSIKAGLDLEMPGPPLYRGSQTQRDLQCGKLLPADIDARAREILKLVKYAKESGIPFDGEESAIDTPETRAFLREAASNAVVLLKNEGNVLPINATKRKIAVIGPNARVAIASGGGSAQMTSTFVTTPLEAIEAAVAENGGTVEYSIGALSYLFLPVATPYLSLSQTPQVEGIASIDFWTTNPGSDFGSGITELPVPNFTTTVATSNAFMVDSLPPAILNGFPYFKYSSTFTPDQTSDWKLSLASVGHSVLFVDGKAFLSNDDNWEQGETFFGMGSTEKIATYLQMKKGHPYHIEIRSWAREAQRSSPVKLAGAIRFGAVPLIDEDQAILDAVEVAKAADEVIVIVGLNEDFESEGHDRKHMDLPGATDKLVSAVLDACPDAVVVTQSGTPIAMPWIDKASTVLHAFYGGNDVGTGIADVVFGKVNPSGKLPVTFPVRLEDAPAGPEFGILSKTWGKAYYSEGLNIGYRHYDKKNIAPLFPFGHGLSYSTFEYSNLLVSSISDVGEFQVSFTIKNVGRVKGKEAAQVYVREVLPALERPLKELKAIIKVDLQPGEAKRVVVDLDKDALKFWDDRESGIWTASKGEFEIMVGSSSVILPLRGVCTLPETITWLGL